MTLVGRSVYPGPAEMYGRSKCVRISARSSLGQICEVHLALASTRTVARTPFFSTHHDHRVKVISPVDEVPTSIQHRIVRRQVPTSLNTIRWVIM